MKTWFRGINAFLFEYWAKLYFLVNCLSKTLLVECSWNCNCRYTYHRCYICLIRIPATFVANLFVKIITEIWVYLFVKMCFMFAGVNDLKEFLSRHRHILGDMDLNEKKKLLRNKIFNLTKLKRDKNAKSRVWAKLCILENSKAWNQVKLVLGLVWDMLCLWIELCVRGRVFEQLQSTEG